MACLICGAERYETVRSYGKPDRYEQYMDIKNIRRTWRYCPNCGFHYQNRNYRLDRLEAIYKKGYRDKAFRGMTIRKAYNQVYMLPEEKSESRLRAKWFKANAGNVESVLDVGSGLGIFPVHLKDLGYNVECTEENVHSLKFIKSALKFKCYDQIPKEKHYDCVSLVHILEHITDPAMFLMQFLPAKLFIEVPDANGWGKLSDDHDDFNSCHLWGFDFRTLDMLLNRVGYKPVAAKRVHHKERGLYRLMMVAECV